MFAELVHLKKYKEGSIKEIVCFHVLEHLYKEDAEYASNEFGKQRKKLSR